VLALRHNYKQKTINFMKQHYKLLLATVILLVSYSASFAQFPNDVRQYNTKNSFWSEFNFFQPLGKDKKKFALQLDFQYRRQSQQYCQKGLADPTKPNLGNIFLNPYQTVFRPWIHYYTNERKLRLSISPIGYWATYGPAGANSTVAGNVPPSSHLQMYGEVRTCAQITTYDQIGRVRMTYRARFEYRWIGNASNQQSYDSDGSGFDFHGPVNGIQKGRMRLFSRADIALKGKTIDPKELYMAVQNEVFLGIGRKTNNAGFFDQNRAYVGVGYKFSDAFRLELGYLNQVVGSSSITTSATAGKPNGTPTVKNMDFNNVLHVFMFFDNVGALFHKKEKEEKEKGARLNSLPGAGI
jgi:hypothetical protein